MTKNNQSEPLSGEDLVKKVKKLGDESKEKKAIECGYYTVNKQGQIRVNKVKFQNALIKARGIDLEMKSNRKSNVGRTANYHISVQSNGNLLIGATYTKQMGLKPGDEFKIILGRKNIRLESIEDQDKSIENED
jgi:hypothetical protein